MAGLVPAIHAPTTRATARRTSASAQKALGDRYVTIALAVRVGHSLGMRRGGWVYIMTNRPNGTLYTGVTNNIARRAYEHREGLIDGFTKQYGLKRLVFMEFYEDVRHAIQRERNMKHWPRRWKAKLILDANPEWRDLYPDLAK